MSFKQGFEKVAFVGTVAKAVGGAVAKGAGYGLGKTITLAGKPFGGLLGTAGTISSGIQQNRKYQNLMQSQLR